MREEGGGRCSLGRAGHRRRAAVPHYVCMYVWSMDAPESGVMWGAEADRRGLSRRMRHEPGTLYRVSPCLAVGRRLLPIGRPRPGGDGGGVV